MKIYSIFFLGFTYFFLFNNYLLNAQYDPNYINVVRRYKTKVKKIKPINKEMEDNITKTAIALHEFNKIMMTSVSGRVLPINRSYYSRKEILEGKKLLTILKTITELRTLSEIKAELGKKKYKSADIFIPSSMNINTYQSSYILISFGGEVTRASVEIISKMDSLLACKYQLFRNGICHCFSTPNLGYFHIEGDINFFYEVIEYMPFPVYLNLHPTCLEYVWIDKKCVLDIKELEKIWIGIRDSN